MPKGSTVHHRFKLTISFLFPNSKTISLNISENMNIFMKFIFFLHLCVGLVSGQYFSSGFYQGGFRAAGFSPFAFQGHPFGGGGGHAGFGGGHAGFGGGHEHAHVHYHVPVSGYHGGFGGGGLGGGVNTRDLGSGRFMTFHTKIFTM